MNRRKNLAFEWKGEKSFGFRRKFYYSFLLSLNPFAIMGVRKKYLF